ncbi:furin-like protease 1, isoforms 1/1-X/2 isoform X2 [Aphidius gifuensis]|uniref:furin-like protease 1, isoforms 1/1-X/2 isoform X2 n=1 Tax=Aphidius gifuensis TaxID=684658 RepID=UPI001CDD7116|nr:furin-like protease 1, isoforms 1/1-X/2 isoform X2 [Aphidius gifuensis]
MYANKLTVYLAVVFLILMECRVGAWSRQWAVHIHVADDDLASDIARDHGFTNNGKIVEGVYHFEHNSLRKRSTEPHLGVHHRLIRDSRVKRAEQQRVKSRKKRDLIVKKVPKELLYLNDNRWPLMWYLNRGNGLDMNVQGAWAEGITGRGVVVTILDDGLEKDHPDLYLNYDPQASYDVNSHDNDPMPRYDPLDSNRHGTRCAGEVAATANNSICAVGVAYGAGVGGVRMLDGDVTDAVEARSLSLNSQHIDIYSASWGPDDDGKTVDGPGELATRAFIEGVTKGRNGKGSIFVWASGNGGREFDDCNCDGYTNSIWTLSISSATENGLVPWYSEACSSTLATTYSSGSGHEKQVVTTDLHHECTSSHTGTSASAPLAAGICALALEANKELTWRDMQHIVVRTAKPANLRAPDWVVNGVGRNVSHSFGYGLMDATAMVRLAKKWRTVPEQRKCEVSSSYTNRGIPSKSHLNLELHVKECSGVNFLEHVQAKISLMASRRGDLMITLTSPQGTKSTLLAKRSNDISKAGFHQWPFMSVHTWGERPHGTWRLVIHNEGRYLGRATLHEWALIFYGTATVPDRTEYALYSPASVNLPKKQLQKLRDSNYSKNALNTYATKIKLNKSGKLNSMSQSYVTNLQQISSSSSSNKKNKLRGQHKNGKSANRQVTKPTVQPQRGLTTGRGSIVTIKPRVRSTPRPLTTSTTILTITTPKNQKKNLKQLAAASATTTTTTTTSAPVQNGLILMEPIVKTININNNNNNNNKVPVVFQQYPKIQQLYPLYPVYAGARGVDQHPARVKGLDLLRDQQIETRNLQLTDKDSLNEWEMVFYGTETPPGIDDEIDKDKSATPDIYANNDNIPPDVHQNVVDTEGDPLLGSQKVDLISHPESQRPTTENHSNAGCNVFNSSRCLGFYISRQHNGLSTGTIYYCTAVRNISTQQLPPHLISTPKLHMYKQKLTFPR